MSLFFQFIFHIDFSAFLNSLDNHSLLFTLLMLTLSFEFLTDNFLFVTLLILYLFHLIFVFIQSDLFPSGTSFAQ
jgi:hypothetical protein